MLQFQGVNGSSDALEVLLMLGVTAHTRLCETYPATMWDEALILSNNLAVLSASFDLTSSSPLPSQPYSKHLAGIS